jgi:microcystin-dependent protein
VNWCEGIEQVDEEDGDLLIYQEESDDCRPKRLRDPVEGEFLGRHPDTGRAAWLQGAVISGGEVPFGVPLEYWGDESSLPANYALCYGQLIPIANAPLLFQAIQHNANGGVDPGGGMFRLPDKRGYVTAGRDDMGGTPANRVTAAAADILGGTLGAETVTLGIGNLPPHTHPVTMGGSGTGISINGAATGISIQGALTGVGIVAAGNHTHPPAIGAFYLYADGPGDPWAGNNFRVGDGTTVLRYAVQNIPRSSGATGAGGGHGHGITDPGHGHGITDPGHTHPGSNAGASGDQLSTPVNKMQPTQFTNYIIRLY